MQNSRAHVQNLRESLGNTADVAQPVEQRFRNFPRSILERAHKSLKIRAEGASGAASVTPNPRSRTPALARKCAKLRLRHIGDVTPALARSPRSGPTRRFRSWG